MRRPAMRSTCPGPCGLAEWAVAVLLQLWIWVPFVALITVCLPLLFPAGQLPGPRWQPVSRAAAGCGVIAAGSSGHRPERRTARNPAAHHHHRDRRFRPAETHPGRLVAAGDVHDDMARFTM